jgi:AcrR family transcriptional regulator
MSDPRSQRSLDAIHSAFFRLVLQKRYHEIKIDDILSSANIARSTFYEHFKSKDALLTSSLYGPLSILASCIDDNADIERVSSLLEHFWENRGLARGIFAGEARRKVAFALADIIRLKLKKANTALRVPQNLASAAIAELLLTSVTEWLLGHAVCEPKALAEALHGAAKTVFRR